MWSILLNFCRIWFKFDEFVVFMALILSNFIQMCPILLNFHWIRWIFDTLGWLLNKFGEFLLNSCPIWFQFVKCWWDFVTFCRLGWALPLLRSKCGQIWWILVEFLSNLIQICQIAANLSQIWLIFVKFCQLWRVLSLICRAFLSNLVNFWKNWTTFGATFIEFWAILMIFGQMWWFFVKFNANSSKFGEYLSKLVNL